MPGIFSLTKTGMGNLTCDHENHLLLIFSLWCFNFAVLKPSHGERGTWGDEQIAVAWQPFLHLLWPKYTRCLTCNSLSSPNVSGAVVCRSWQLRSSQAFILNTVDARFLAPVIEKIRAENVSIYYTCVQFIIEHITISSLCFRSNRRSSMTTGTLFVRWYLASNYLYFDLKWWLV